MLFIYLHIGEEYFIIFMNMNTYELISYNIIKDSDEKWIIPARVKNELLRFLFGNRMNVGLYMKLLKITQKEQKLI